MSIEIAATPRPTPFWTRPGVRTLLVFAACLIGLSIARMLNLRNADPQGIFFAGGITGSNTISTALGLAMPIAMAGLGGLISERVGVVNIGLDGMMVLGTWFAGYAGWQWGPVAALVGGIFGGALGGALHALATVTFGVDHTVSGVAINLIAPGVARFLSADIFSTGRGHAEGGTISDSPPVPPLDSFTMPWLAKQTKLVPSDVPGEAPFSEITNGVLGRIEDKHWFVVSDSAGIVRGLLADLRYSTLVLLVMVPLVWYVLWKTPFGLRLRSIGERPGAADSLGVNVNLTKWIGVTASGALAGLGGAWLVLDINKYQQGMVAGRGFQGVAAMIFGNWRPAGTLAGAGLFAFAQSVTLQSGEPTPVIGLLFVVALAFVLLAAWSLYRRRWPSVGVLSVLGCLLLVFCAQATAVNAQITFALPYVIVLIVLFFSSDRIRPPAASGRPWRKGDSS